MTNPVTQQLRTPPECTPTEGSEMKLPKSFRTAGAANATVYVIDSELMP
jgi:hypothetical protein